MIDLSELDPTLVAAIVSALVSFVILILSNFVVQPRRWKQNVEQDNLEKRLKIYGSLLTILKSLFEKGKRQLKEGQEPSYRLELPADYERMIKIFEESNYLLSKEISQKWLDFIKADTYFAIRTAYKKGSGLLSGFDFSEMQKLVEKEYEDLKEEYEKLTSIKIS